MAGLLDLPDEILTFIFEELVEEGVFWRYQTSWKDKQSLLCLMRTNRRLNVLASRILMRGIDITIMSTDEDGEEDGKSFCIFVDLFQSSVVETFGVLILHPLIIFFAVRMLTNGKQLPIFSTMGYWRP